MDRRVRYLQDLLNQRIQHDWTIDEMASSVNLSASHLKRLFKIHAGTPPGEYLSTLRIEKAREMLADPDNFLRLKEICFQVGIISEGQFSRDFKKHFGMTPTEYRSIHETASEVASIRTDDTQNQEIALMAVKEPLNC